MARIFVEEENRELAERLFDKSGFPFDIDGADRFIIADENLIYECFACVGAERD